MCSMRIFRPALCMLIIAPSDPGNKNATPAVVALNDGATQENNDVTPTHLALNGRPTVGNRDVTPPRLALNGRAMQ